MAIRKMGGNMSQKLKNARLRANKAYQTAKKSKKMMWILLPIVGIGLAFVGIAMKDKILTSIPALAKMMGYEVITNTDKSKTLKKIA